MKSTSLAVMCACLLCVIVSAYGASGQDGRPPGLFVPYDSHEFSPVPDGVEVVHTYVVQNTGAEPVYIHKVQTG